MCSISTVLGVGEVASRAFNLRCTFAALDHFIEGFPTYAGLLKEIKKEFETALNRVIVFARDNVHLRQQRSADKVAKSQAVDKAYQKVLDQSFLTQNLQHWILCSQQLHAYTVLWYLSNLL